MNRIEKAIEIALQAHAGQTDRYGAPYILHVLRVGLKGVNEEEIQAGILHDVIEDSAITADDLKQAGFSTEVVDAVVALSKVPGEVYEDFIRRLSRNPLAAQVKTYDLNDNMNLLRVKGGLSPDDLARLNRYLHALQFLASEESKRPG